MEGFLTDLWSAMIFFRYCRRYNIEDLQEKRRVLGRLAKKKKATFFRDAAPLLEGKNILRISAKRKPEL